MNIILEDIEKFDCPDYVISRMTCLWKNRQKLRELDEETYKNLMLDSCEEVICDLGNYTDQYYLKLQVEPDSEEYRYIEVEVLPEKIAYINDIEYIKHWGKNIEHELAHHKVGEVYSNFCYLGETKEEGKLYFRDLG